MKMLSRIFCGTAVAAAMMLSSTVTPAIATEWPERAVRVVVPFAAGSSSDIAARRISAGMAEVTGGSFVAENLTGAGGIIGTQTAARAHGDPHTLLVGTISTHALNPWLHRELPYDPLADFTPITRIIAFPNVIVVRNSLGVETMDELIALSKERAEAGQPLTHSSGGIGSTSHLGPALLAQVAETEFLHIPYDGAGPAVADVVAGRIDVVFGNISVVLPHIQSGAVTPVAVTSGERHELLPDVPSVAELDLADAEMSAWIALFAPSGLSDDIVTQIGDAALAALELPSVQEGFARDGTDIVSDSSPEEFRAYIQGELDRWQRVVEASDITPQ